MNETATIPSMIFYHHFMEAAQATGMTPEQRCEFYEGIMTYQFSEEIPDFSLPAQQGLFLAVKPLLDSNQLKQRQYRKAKENGRKGGAPKGNRNACKSDKSKKSSAVKTTPETTPKTTIINNNDNINNKLIDSPLSVSLPSLEGREGAEREEVRKKKETVRPTASFEDRKEQFVIAVESYKAKYDLEYLLHFFIYWSAPVEGTELMRFETVPSWNLPYQLRHWVRPADGTLPSGDATGRNGCTDTECHTQPPTTSHATNEAETCEQQEDYRDSDETCGTDCTNDREMTEMDYSMEQQPPYDSRPAAKITTATRYAHQPLPRSPRPSAKGKELANTDNHLSPGHILRPSDNCHPTPTPNETPHSFNETPYSSNKTPHSSNETPHSSPPSDT